ncbi:transposase [Streptomyces sp. NPDC092296]|uniref:transposase n=1 Tax=Streptomyces sp. NPDC092296 TaxID=3366012 RepID=UPI00381C9C80
MRATYNRYDGVMHMLAALDLATGKMYYRIGPRKRRREFLAPLKSLRARRPGGKPYVVLDNFSPHKHANVRVRAAANDLELVFLPTYASNHHRCHTALGDHAPNTCVNNPAVRYT